ncbi:MAG TPA: ABC transporter substrate-binding protein [Candidatus Paceibacterota bacterium]|mgnify:CR=1 FL=1|nr:ABC transporter substrate-binding protein [Candidatus Paceibacterota bacterium]
MSAFSKKYWRLFSLKEKAVLLLLTITTLLAAIFLTISLSKKYLKTYPAVGGQMTVGIVGQPFILNPILTQANEADSELEALIYNGLFTYDNQGELKPSLAQSYNVSDDGKTYTVILNKNVLWQDGADFTADDVIFTIESIQDPDYNSPWRANWLGVVVEKMNDNVVVFHLNEPYVGFKDNLTMKIVPAHIWGQINVKNIALAKYSLQPVGTGPYVFSKLVKDKLGNIITYDLKANDHYFEKLPNISFITYHFYKNYNELKDAFQKKEISSLANVPYDLKPLFKNREAYLKSIELPRYYSVFYNLKSNNALLSAADTRLALNLAINREAINQTIFGGSLLPANNLISQSFLGYNTSPSVDLTYNPTKSHELLAETFNFNSSSVWERIIKQKKQPTKYEPVSLTLTVADLPELKAAANAIKTDWDRIGIPTTLQVVSLDDLENDIIPNKKYDALLFGEFYGQEPDPYNFWHTGGSLNLSNFSNKTVDALLEEIQLIDDRAKRQDDLIELQNILLENSPCFTLGNPLQFYALSPSIAGNTLTTGNYLADRYNNVSDWYMHVRLGR